MLRSINSNAPRVKQATIFLGVELFILKTIIDSLFLLNNCILINYSLNIGVFYNINVSVL